MMTSKTVEVSIVIPEYKGKTMIQELYERLCKTLMAIDITFEIIFVNDCSPDDCWEDIEKLCAKDFRVKGINLARNFGQHYAITAGLANTSGNYIVVMDCDLQDVPEEIPKLYSKAKEGYDSVFAQRQQRKDLLYRRIQSKLFYAVFGYLTDSKLDASVANFGIYNRRVINAILQLGDKVKYFPTMARFVGFKQISLPVVHAERKIGQSSYSLFSLLKLSCDTIIAFSNKPLRLFATLGFLTTIISFFIFLFFLILHCLDKIKVLGWASLILSIWAVGGLLMFGMGVLGIYIGKVFDQVKNRPTFIIATKKNLNSDYEN